MVVPDDVVEHVAAVKSITQRLAPVLDQAVVCDFITQGTSVAMCGACAKYMRGVLSLLLDLAGTP